MGDKDSPLDGLFDGKQRIITFYDVTDGKQISDEIIADSLAYEVPIAEDSLRFDEDHLTANLIETPKNVQFLLRTPRV